MMTLEMLPCPGANAVSKNQQFDPNRFVGKSLSVGGGYCHGFYENGVFRVEGCTSLPETKLCTPMTEQQMDGVGLKILNCPFVRDG